MRYWIDAGRYIEWPDDVDSVSFTTPWFDTGQFGETPIPEPFLKAFEE